MKKLLVLEIEDVCHDCPCCHYEDYHYGSSDSGYECTYDVTKRIASDLQITEYNEKLRKFRQMKDSLFPIKEIPVDPMLIPDWCPLPTK